MNQKGTFWRVLALVLGFSIIGFGAIIVSRRPTNGREWAVDQARVPEIVFDDSLARVANVRDFHYRSLEDFDIRYETKTYRINHLNSVWLVLTPFSKTWRGAAHTFVSFGFDDSTFVAISIEARREANEEYGLLKGLGRNYELIYLIGEERDLIGKRAAFGDFDVYLYPIRTTPERARAVFVDMLKRAQRLGNQPEFYNTISNSCTSNLVRHVNQVVPGRIPMGIKLLMPGYADEIAQALGLVDASTSIEAARVRYRINDQAKAGLNQPDFSGRIRQ